MVDSYPNAARRLRRDANCLAANNRFQNAGHLIGFAAECLVKEQLQHQIAVDRASGLQVHFPELTERIRRKGEGRLMGSFLTIINRHDFLGGWKAELRYEQDISGEVAQNRWNKWVEDVERLFKAVGVI